MTEIIQETTTRGTNQEATTNQTVGYLVYFFFGILEVLLLFRVALMLTGASRTSGFVDMIYSLTSVFVLPFQGIFRNSVAQGAETASVFEPASIVAIIVYPLIAYGIVKLIRVLSGERQVE